MELLIYLFGSAFQTAVLIYFYYQLLENDKIIDRKKLESLYIAAGCIILAVAYINQPVIRFIGMVLFPFIPLIMYDLNKVRKIMLIITYAFIRVTAELFLYAIDLNNYFEKTIILNLYLLMFFMITIFLVRVIQNRIPIYVPIILLAFPTLTIIGIYTMEKAYMIAEVGHIEMVAQYSFFIIINIVIFYLFSQFASYQEIKTQSLANEILLKEQEKYNAELMQQQEEINKIYSDLSQLFKFEGKLYKGSSYVEELKDYIKVMSGQLEKNKLLNTGYGSLDMIVTRKKELAAQQDTRLNMSVILSKEINIDMADVAIIIANCLDNALEATRDIIDTSKRWISLNIIREGAYLDIIINNSVAHKVDIKNNKIKTSKRDQFNHGFGLRNVEKLVEKYDGSLNLECDNEKFTTTILLKIE